MDDYLERKPIKGWAGPKKELYLFEPGMEHGDNPPPSYRGPWSEDWSYSRQTSTILKAGYVRFGRCDDSIHGDSGRCVFIHWDSRIRGANGRALEVLRWLRSSERDAVVTLCWTGGGLYGKGRELNDRDFTLSEAIRKVRELAKRHK